MKIKKITTTNEDYAFSKEQVFHAVWKTYFRGKVPDLKDVAWFSLEHGRAKLRLKTVKEENL